MNVLENTYYINLDHRTDRKDRVIAELTKIGIKGPTRFPAIKTTSGAIGCSMSHIKCIELAIKHNYPHIFICEDDICFTDPASLLNSLNLFQNNVSNHEWDVILVAGNNCPPYSRVGDYAIRVTNCQTATGYIVNNHYYNKLLSNFKEGVSQLVREPDNKRNYACDMYWKRLQQSDRWFMLTPPTVIQYADYSNIENKEVSYGHLMLDLDKTWLFSGQPPPPPLPQPQQPQRPQQPQQLPTRSTIQMPLLYNINSTFSLI